MKSTKLLSLILAGALSVGALAGCSQSQAANDSSSSASVSSQTEATQASDAEVEARQLLKDLTGSYQELWPVLLDPEYEQLWIDDAAAQVGQADAKSAVEMLQASVNGTLYGEEAIEAYGEDGGSFYCGWTGNLAEFTLDGDDSTIRGKDASGKELFSGTYHYVATEGDFTVFESEDAADDYRYFAFRPDTPETTFHIEFRYGPSLEGLGDMMTGEYAFWMASGIQTDYTKQTVEEDIKLFCEENLSE